MTTKIMKKTLEDENKLLEAMMDCIKKFPSGDFTEQAVDIRDSWLRFLTDRYNTNDKQRGRNDRDLKEDFLTEICQLGAYIHATPNDKKYTEEWKVFLECERDISARLLRLIGR